MFHCVEADKCAGSTETGFAMNSNSSRFLFSNVKEILHNIIWWRRAINEKEIRMIDAIAHELVLIIFCFI